MLSGSTDNRNWCTVEQWKNRIRSTTGGKGGVTISHFTFVAFSNIAEMRYCNALTTKHAEDFSPLFKQTFYFLLMDKLLIL